MESMALYQETAYEKLYRWTQGNFPQFYVLTSNKYIQNNNVHSNK